MPTVESSRRLRRIPTMGFEMRLADKVVAAIRHRDPQALNRLRVPWFDWRFRRWRLDHEGWMHTHGWLSAPEYGGWLRVRASGRHPVPERPRFAHEVIDMPKLKVVPKADAVETEEVETATPKRGRKKAAAEATAPAKGSKEKTAKVSKFIGVTTGMRVVEYQNKLMAENFKKKLTDEELAALMRREFPEAAQYTAGHVSGIRTAWNKGAHSNVAPDRPLPEFDEAGKPQPVWGSKAAEKRAAKEEAEVETAKPAAKVKRRKAS